MRAVLCLSGIALIAAAPAAHADLCQDIHTFGGQSSDIQLVLPTTEETANCTRSLMLSGGSQVHCAWAFPYRAPMATKAFKKLLSTVGDCLGSAARATSDVNVNHPDFYDLQTFQFEGQEIGVSLKDKAALSETYVFLRVWLPK